MNEGIDSPGKRLKLIRKDLNLTQDQFCEEIGISQSNLSLIEQGKLDITLSTIKILRGNYKINPAWLIDGEGEKVLGKKTINTTDTEMELLRLILKDQDSKLSLSIKRIEELEIKLSRVKDIL